MEDKKTGSYYTPHETINFMRQYLMNTNNSYSTMIEPCAGDGRFLDAFVNEHTIDQIFAIELFEEKTDYLKQKNYNQKVSIVTSDFLKYAVNTNDKYSLIIGNPPYVNVKNMDESALEECKKICEKHGLAKRIVQNLWVAFVLASTSLVKEDGTIFYVLPMEFLQVQYAEKLREILEKLFNTIHIIVFEEKMFPEIEQETCLVYLSNQKNTQPYISYRKYEKLNSNKANLETKIERNKPLKKWSNAILSDNDMDLIKTIGSRYTKLSQIGESSPGIVTAGNNKFILTEEEVNDLHCRNLTIPIISKAAMVRNNFIINDSLITSLANAGKKVYLLNLALFKDENDLPSALRAYLEQVGNEIRSGKKIKESYKCKNRNPWYGVPIVQSGDIAFFKRYDLFPRLCLNPGHIHTTDIAYNIRLKKDYDAASIAFCFYNSYTLLQCEYVGRYYGGGVSELTPSEFKSLTIPYHKIPQEDINQLNTLMSSGASIDQIVKYVNAKTLSYDLRSDVIERIDRIREQLIRRRK